MTIEFDFILNLTMARRGADRIDIKTNEELDELLKKKCLHVLNVYDGFFGPCNAIATNLREFKRMHGGEDLMVATVNVDQIDVFKRFREKSEPAFLMVSDGRIVNSFFGSDVTQLLEIIKQEIAYFKSGEQSGRQTFDLREMSVLEAQRFRAKREEMIENQNQYQMKKHKLIYDYRMHVTASIMDNVAETGVTVIMPHVMDENLLANLIDAAQKKNLILKTNVTAKITREDLEMINFDVENMSPLLFNHVRDREVMIIAWKMESADLKPIDEVFSEFAKSLRAELDFEKVNVKKGEKKDPKKKEVKAKVEKTDEENLEALPLKLQPLAVRLNNLKKKKLDPIKIEPIDLQFIESDQDVIKLVSESITTFTEKIIIRLHHQCIADSLIKLIDNSKPEVEEGASKPKKTRRKQISKVNKSKAKDEMIYDPKHNDTGYICPVWCPPTPRAHASFLFLYFRKLLSFFLPMDPPGADRFVIVVFPATRHEEVLNFLKDNLQYEKEILARGMFNGFVDGGNFENTKLICKTGVEYRMRDAAPGDKLILQVVSNSDALLDLADLEPEFVSQNEHDAQIECDVIFPLGYISISEDEVAAQIEEERAELEAERAAKEEAEKENEE